MYARSLTIFRTCLVLITLFAIGLSAYFFWLAHAEKQDALLSDTVGRIGDSINSYVSTANAIPDSLTGVYGKSTPREVSYTKLSSTSYTLCVVYLTKSSSFSSDNSPWDNRGNDGSYNNALYITKDTSHNKGRNCITIRPQFASPSTDPRLEAIASGNQETVCQIPGYQTHYAGTILSIRTTDGQPIVPTTSQDLVVTVQPISQGMKSVQTVLVKTTTYNVFNRSCTAIEHESMQPGDQVSIFQSSDSVAVNAVVDFNQ